MNQTESQYPCKEQPEIAKYALVNGLVKASEMFNVNPTLIREWISALPYEELPLISYLRKYIVKIARRKGLEGCSRFFDIPIPLLESFLQYHFLNNPLTQGEDFIFTREAQIQTENLARRPTADKDLQVKRKLPDREPSPSPAKTPRKDEKRVTKKYTTADKITAVREFVKKPNQSEAARELQIPAVNLLRWRDKILNELFQEKHIESLYKVGKKGQKNKFFKELDEGLYNWYLKNKDTLPDLDEALIRKAKNIGKVDEREPRVSPEWLKYFKLHFNLS